jgi:hypothetical protein
MSDNEPSGRRIRYIPGHLASGTMRGAREPAFGRPSTVFFVIISLDDSMRCKGGVTADKGTEPFCVFAVLVTADTFAARSQQRSFALTRERTERPKWLGSHASHALLARQRIGAIAPIMEIIVGDQSSKHGVLSVHTPSSKPSEPSTHTDRKAVLSGAARTGIPANVIRVNSIHVEPPGYRKNYSRVAPRRHATAQNRTE